MANIELDGPNKKIKVDSGDLTLDVPGDIVLDADGGDVVVADGGTNILKVSNSSSDVVLQPQVDAKDIIFKQYDGTTVATVEDNGTFNFPTDKLAINGTAVTSTAAELNILDGVTATAAELNLIDGGTARGTTAIADGDGVLINDAGTMRQTTVETLKTYIGGFDVSSITGATALTERPATTDEFVFSDNGTLKRVDFTHMTNWELLATVTASGASTVEFDDYFSSTYHYYRLFINSAELSANDSYLDVQMRISTSYQTGASDYFSARYGRKSNGNNNSADVATGDYDYSQIPLNNGAAYFTNDKNMQGYVDIWNPLDSHHTVISSKLLYDLNEDIAQIEVTGGLKSTSAVTGIRFVTPTSATISGEFKLYGFK